MFNISIWLVLIHIQKKKEKGIKFFKEKFKGNIIDQPSFIMDNTSIIKKIRFASNLFK